MAAAGLVLLTGTMNPWALVAVAVVVGTLDGFFLPAVAALPVRIAPPHLIGRVAALRTLTQRKGMLGGGPLAGWLIYLFGPSARLSRLRGPVRALGRIARPGHPGTELVPRPHSSTGQRRPGSRHLSALRPHHHRHHPHRQHLATPPRPADEPSRTRDQAERALENEPAVQHEPATQLALAPSSR